MKKIVLSVAAVLAVASFGYAASIVGSKHDMSVAKNIKVGGGTGEICVFCHTPHNAYKNVPLWNRANPSPQETYRTSITLTTAAKNSTMAMDSISAFCMSCHDGVTKIGAIKNVPVQTAGGDTQWSVADTTTLNGSYGSLTNFGTEVAGTSLKNDHPIGFSYSAAAAEDAGLVAFDATNHDTTAKLGYNNQGVFYGPSGDQMECASCHKVHDPGTSGNFLRKENDGSKLCLACHAK